MSIETLGEIRAKYNFWNEKERPYYEALSEAIRVISAQKDKLHYAKIVRCGKCKRHSTCTRYRQAKNDDWFCADGEREVQE